MQRGSFSGSIMLDLGVERHGAREAGSLPNVVGDLSVDSLKRLGRRGGKGTRYQVGVRSR